MSHEQVATHAKLLALVLGTRIEKGVQNAPVPTNKCNHAIREFIEWYCSEPRLAFNKIVVTPYRIFLEQANYASSTINLRLAAVRRLAYEASDAGLLTPDLAATIRRVRGGKKHGVRLGDWLIADQGLSLLSMFNRECLRGKRDYAVVATLLGCGLRRAELASLSLQELQKREEHWVFADLVGKEDIYGLCRFRIGLVKRFKNGSPLQVYQKGPIFRAINKVGRIAPSEFSPKFIWGVVREAASKCGLLGVAPHDLRRTCARLCHQAGGELEQIQFLLGHISVETTEQCLGCKQRLRDAVNDRIGLEPISSKAL